MAIAGLLLLPIAIPSAFRRIDIVSCGRIHICTAIEGDRFLGSRSSSSAKLPEYNWAELELGVPRAAALDNYQIKDRAGNTTHLGDDPATVRKVLESDALDKETRCANNALDFGVDTAQCGLEE